MLYTKEKETDIGVLAAEFNDISNKTQSDINDILSALAEERMPSSALVDIFNERLGELRIKYNAIFTQAQKLLKPDEMPPEGISVSEYINAVETSRYNSIRQQLNEMRNTINRFLNVSSLVETYSAAIKPFQDKARNMLQDINADDIDGYNNILKGYEGPDAFLKFMELSDDEMDSDKGEELQKKVEEYYPDRNISRGLARRKYFIAESDELFVEEVENKSIVNANGENTVDEKLHLKEDKSDKSSENAVEQKTEHKEYVQNELKEIKQVDNNTEGMLKPINEIKKGKVNANSFKNDIKKISTSISIPTVVLAMFTKFGMMTCDQICRFITCMYTSSDDSDNKFDAIAKESLEILENKGFIAKYVKDNNVAYCLTEYTYGCMTKETIKKFECDDSILFAPRMANGRHKHTWGNMMGKYKLCRGNGAYPEEISNIIALNEKLLQYLENIKVFCTKEEYDSIVNVSGNEDGSYDVIVMHEGEALKCRLVVTFEEASECRHENILYICDETDDVPFTNEYCKHLFIYKNGEISESKHTSTDDSSLEALSAVSVDTTEVGEEAANESTEIDGSEVPMTEAQPVHEEVVEIINDVDEIPYSEASDFKVNEKETDTEESPDPTIIAKTPSDDEFCKLIDEITNKKVTDEKEINTCVTEAILLAKAAAMVKQNSRTELLYKKLLAATTLPLREFRYTSEQLAQIFDPSDTEDECLVISAYMYAMLVPETPYDFGMKNMTDQFLKEYDSYFPSLDAVKNLFNTLKKIGKLSPMGFSKSIIAILGDNAENEKFISELKKQAKDLQELPNIKVKMKNMPKMYNNCFGPESEFYNCLQNIIDDKTDSDSIEYAEILLSDYCNEQEDIYTPDEEKINEIMTKAWYDVNPGNHYPLAYGAKPAAQRQFLNRLNLIKVWVEHNKSKEGNIVDVGKVKNLRDDIIICIDEAYEKCADIDVKYVNVLRFMLGQMKAHLTGNVDYIKTFSELLSTGIISMDDNGLPIMNEGFVYVKYYEPWRLVMNHIKSQKPSLEDVRKSILEAGSDVFDNFQQLKLINHLLKNSEKVSDSDIEQAIKSAELEMEKFKEDIELDYTYNRIMETQKESLLALASKYEKVFYDIRDFGRWRQFLKALRKQVNEYSERRRAELMTALNKSLAVIGPNETSPILEEAKNMLEVENNFAVAEEYINRFDIGDRDIIPEADIGDAFNNFISDDVFIPIFDECKRKTGDALKYFGKNYIEKNMPKEWTARLREDSSRLISNWPAGRNATTEQIKTLFTGLGLNVKEVKRIPKKEITFAMRVSPVPKGMADYRHPISAFGTQIKSPVNVITLYGSYTAKQLVDTVTSLNLGGMAIVLIDCPLDRTVRRQICEIFHRSTSRQNAFLLIDRVLAIYLALHQSTERLPILLKCALPYTSYQPFVRDGGSTADEMFFGRTKELEAIMNLNGASIVYGGRQLGKTALLERAENRCMKPENHEYAIYVSIMKCKTEEMVAKKIVDGVNRKSDLNLKSCDTIEKLCSQINELYISKKISTMRLFLDETDDFLDAISGDRYMQLLPFIDLRRNTQNNFKFVLAGLHNVCRAKNAMKDNGIFGQMGAPLCIKPLKPSEALQLLSNPLNYLGFRIEKQSHLETILTKSNCYPGILQFSGYMLVDTLTGDYDKYYSASENPPFTLRDEQLGSVMNSADLNNSIREKIRMSLALDPRYFMLARCIALLYCYEDESSPNWTGFSVSKIKEMADDYDIICLSNEEERDYINLLDEMVEMGILSCPSKDLYRFRRNSFIDIIGADIDELDKDINENNKEGI